MELTSKGTPKITINTLQYYYNIQNGDSMTEEEHEKYERHKKAKDERDKKVSIIFLIFMSVSLIGGLVFIVTGS